VTPPCNTCRNHPSACACQTATDPVNHPDHYGGQHDPYEAIKVIEAWNVGFHLGNVLKYVARAGRKDDRLTDLRKARFYLDREIQRQEQQ